MYILIYISTLLVNPAKYGLFVHSGPFRKYSGLLDNNKTLESYNIDEEEIIELRKKERTIKILTKDEAVHLITIYDTATVAEIVPIVLQQLGTTLKMGEYYNYRDTSDSHDRSNRNSKNVTTSSYDLARYIMSLAEMPDDINGIISFL